MANKRFWYGILVMVLVFGMTVVGCDDLLGEEDDKTSYSFEGTWESHTKDTLTFNDNNYYCRESPQVPHKGKFTYTSTHITFNITHRESSSGNWTETNEAGAYIWIKQNEGLAYSFSSYYSFVQEKDIPILTINGKSFYKQ
jgi:hypothetical protein